MLQALFYNVSFFNILLCTSCHSVINLKKMTMAIHFFVKEKDET